jgi:hypothetical protein
MSNATVRHTVSLKEAAAAIVAVRKNRYMLMGEPGIGKSAIIKALEEATGYPSAYIDCPNLDIGDVAMPVINHETKTTGFYPNARFKLHEGEPVIIMLDEFTKAMDPVKNMLHPLLEVNNPRLGDVPVPEGSIIFLTGNLEDDGVGDSMLAHTKMRITRVEVTKPNHEEWLPWAANNGIHPVVMAWVKRNPECLASYRDGASSPYIFDPSKVQGAVVTPRTLELASNIVREKDNMPFNAMLASLAGTIGEAAAESMAAFIRHYDALPKWEEIMKNPTGCRLPEDSNAGAMSMIVFNAVQRIQNKDDVSSMLKYLNRADEEWQTLFCLAIASDAKKQSMAFSCGAFAEWVVKNEDLL